MKLETPNGKKDYENLKKNVIWAYERAYGKLSDGEKNEYEKPYEKLSVDEKKVFDQTYRKPKS